MSERHALFDPRSRYSLLRDCASVPEKIRSYFNWQKKLSEKGGYQPGKPLPSLVLRAGSPPAFVAARVTLPQEPVLGDRFRVEVALLDDKDTCACRAFLVDRPVLDRLRQVAAPGVVCREDDALTIYDLATGERRAKAPGVRDPLRAVVLDESRLVVLTGQGELLLWDCGANEVRSILETHKRLPDGQLASLGDDWVAWTAPAGNLVFVTKVEESPTPRQTRGSVGPRAAAKLPQPMTQEMLGPFDAEVRALLGLPDSQVVVGLANGVVKLGNRSWHFQDEGGIVALALVEGRIAAATAAGVVRLWRPQDRQAETLAGVKATSFAPLPGDALALGGPDGVAVLSKGETKPRWLSEARAATVLPAPGERVLQVTEDSLRLWTLDGEGRLLRTSEKDTQPLKPLVCGRLRPFLVGDDKGALQQLFDHRTLIELLAAQQATSAMPEVSGSLEQGAGVLEVGIPTGCPNLGADARVVVVLEG